MNSETETNAEFDAKNYREKKLKLWQFFSTKLLLYLYEIVSVQEDVWMRYENLD